MVDESTGMAVVNYLRSLGYDVFAVAEAIPQADDSDILARASSEGRILVTNDKDFGELPSVAVRCIRECCYFGFKTRGLPIACEY